MAITPEGPGAGPAAQTGLQATDAYTAAQAAQDASAHHSTRSFKIWRGAAGKGEFVEYKQDVVEGMVVLDAVHEMVTDVSWNFEVKKKVQKFTPRPPDAADGTWRMQQVDVDRVQDFRKCIECFLCQDVCHVLRDHGKHDSFIGPRFLVHA